MQDLSQLSDPELIAERARVRDELERQGDCTNRDDLTQVLDAVADELARRMGGDHGRLPAEANAGRECAA